MDHLNIIFSQNVLWYFHQNQGQTQIYLDFIILVTQWCTATCWTHTANANHTTADNITSYITKQLIVFDWNHHRLLYLTIKLYFSSLAISCGRLGESYGFSDLCREIWLINCVMIYCRNNIIAVFPDLLWRRHLSTDVINFKIINKRV